MKKLYSLFILIFCSVLFGQEYRPLLQENNVWEVQNYIGEGETVDFIYRLSDEILHFNGKDYIKLDITNNFWLDVYLHENLTEKKVYVYYPESGEEHILYDFNLNVGDPLPLNGYFNYNGEEAVVELITYENVFGLENVKTFRSGGLKIYEGIGAHSGLFTLVGAIDDSYFLSEFYQEDDYTPLIQEGKGWEFSYNQWDFNNGGMHYKDYKAKLSGEQISYNDKVYHAIEVTSRERIEDTPQTEWSEWATEFYLSENTNQRKVYIYYPDGNSFNHQSGEFLLYDFGLEENDVMHLDGFVNASIIENAMVTSVSYEDVYGMENVRTQNLMADDEFEFKVYEGIGSSSGLITMSFLIDSGWTLTHYGILSNEEIQAKSTKVYPNPFKDKIQIQNSEEIIEYQLFDLQGKLLSKNKNLEELNSKLSSLNNAIYFLKITFKNNKSETIKLIKNK